MNELIAHIQSINVRTAAWLAESPETRSAGVLVEDAAYWAEQGVTTVEEFQRSMLIDAISDCYKDKYGSRPRFLKFNEMSLQELQDYFNDL